MKNGVRLLTTIVCFVFLTLGTSAYGDEPTLNGKWQMVAQKTDNSKVTVNLDISDVITAFSKVCESSGQAITVVVEVPTKISDGIFEIQGSATQTNKAGGFECTIDVKPEVLKYTLDLSHLTLTNAAGTSLIFDRIK